MILIFSTKIETVNSSLNESQAKEQLNLYDRRIKVKSSLDVMNSSAVNNKPLSAAGDYSLSQNVNMTTNHNVGFTNNQFSINIKGSKLPKSRLRYHINPLTNVMDGDPMQRSRLKDYENILSNESNKAALHKDPITKSQKELINKTYDVRQDRLHTRNAINPITGDFSMPSISVKGSNQANLRGYF